MVVGADVRQGAGRQSAPFNDFEDVESVPRGYRRLSRMRSDMDGSGADQKRRSSTGSVKATIAMRIQPTSDAAPTRHPANTINRIQAAMMCACQESNRIVAV